MFRPGRAFLSYLGAVVVTLAAATTGVLSVNLMVDPFWFFGGNKVFPRNLPFNERASKTNVFLKSPRQYDCLILGSSRVTLLDESRIDGHRCFNFAFSNGSVREFAEFAEYARARGMAPRRVIVGINEEQFWPIAFKSDTPDFVHELTDPPGWGSVYFSLRALDFSLRTLLRQYPLVRYYDRSLRADTLPGTPPFDPGRLASEGPPQPFDVRSKPLFRRLLAVFPDAEYIGYAPPLSVWWVKRFEDAGGLDDYVAAVYEVSRMFHRFYDFSIPSTVTSDRANTYDGEHFFRPVNAMVAGVLNGRATAGFGVDLHAVSAADYRRRFRSALDRFTSVAAAGSPADAQAGRALSMASGDETADVRRRGDADE